MCNVWNVAHFDLLLDFSLLGFLMIFAVKMCLQKEMEFLSGAGMTTMWKASHSTHSTAKAWKLLLLFTSLDQLRFPHKIQSDLCYLCSLISNMFMKTAGAFSEFFCTSFRSQCGWKPPIRVHHAPSLHGFANSPTATGGVKRFRYIKQHATSISEKLRGWCNLLQHARCCDFPQNFKWGKIQWNGRMVISLVFWDSPLVIWMAGAQLIFRNFCAIDRGDFQCDGFENCQDRRPSRWSETIGGYGSIMVEFHAWKHGEKM